MIPLLRRVRDSNPRSCYRQRFSRPPHSTTLPTLRRKSTNSAIYCKFNYTFFSSSNHKNRQLHEAHDNKMMAEIKNLPIVMTGRFPFVRQSGFEPETDGLENRCSIQLSYWRSSKSMQK